MNNSVMAIVAVASFVIGLIIQIFTAGFLIGNFSNAQKNLEKLFKGFKDDIEKKFTDLKTDTKDSINNLTDNINEKIKENNEHTSDHIRRLEMKQDKHNNLIERTYKTEGSIEKIEEQIKVANHRIEDLERENEK